MSLLPLLLLKSTNTIILIPALLVLLLLMPLLLPLLLLTLLRLLLSARFRRVDAHGKQFRYEQYDAGQPPRAASPLRQPESKGGELKSYHTFMHFNFFSSLFPIEIFIRISQVQLQRSERFPFTQSHCQENYGLKRFAPRALPVTQRICIDFSLLFFQKKAKIRTHASRNSYT